MGNLGGIRRVPRALCSMPRAHSSPDHDPDPLARFAMDTAIVHIANELNRMHEQEIDRDVLLSGINSDAWEITSLVPEDLLPLRDQAIKELDETIGMLLGGDAAA